MRSRIQQLLEADLGEPVTLPAYCGGVASTASGRLLYLKSGEPSGAFRCEAVGLREIAATGTVKTAHVASVGEDYIATEYIRQGERGVGFFEDLGRDLARMHRATAPEFGFREDNFIGANPQKNVPDAQEAADWAVFYFNKRLLFQYRLAERNGYATPQMASAFTTLERRMKAILSGSEEPPALLHGDLWAGNCLCDESGGAVLIDPAVYYGHREADLAMTKLFGGFPAGFYRAYNDENPLPAGWERREPLYRLYHLMNHLNLFGRSYLREAEQILEFYTR